MKLRNKKTGEIVETDYKFSVSVPDIEKFYGNKTYTEIKGYSSIKELSQDWEDYEEPTEVWYIDWKGDIRSADIGDDWECEKKIGNYFETKEEAEKVVEKLKAWKRLKDNGFRFYGIKEDYTRINGNYIPNRNGRRYLQFNKSEDDEWLKENWKDLDLLFGGEE